MQILLNNNDFEIYYLKLTRNRISIEDELILSFNKLFRQNILNQIENITKIDIIVKSIDNIPFYLYCTKFNTNYIYLLEEHENEGEILMDVNMMNENDGKAVGDIYNQFIVDVFYNWSCNNEIDWNMINIKRKKDYLKACYWWGGRRFKINDVNYIMIDGELITCDEDIFYYLGESFFGKRGYFGSNLDSLQDLLIDIVKNNEINSKIKFKNIDLIINNTNKYFIDTLIYLLEKAKFKIEII